MQFNKAPLSVMILASVGLVACGGGGGGGGSTTPTNDPSFQEQAVSNGQVSFQDGASLATFSLSGSSFAVDTGSTTPATALPAGFDTANYFGAVDPGASSPFWWEGWTAHVAGGDGSLLSSTVHPLSDNYGNTQSPNIDPAGSSACSTLDTDFLDGGTVDILGETFPVCIINETALTNNADGSTVSLPNNHVFLLDGFAAVGNGGGQQADPATVNNVTLEIAEGTMVFGSTQTSGSLVVTRGSNLVVNGSAEAPVVFSGVETVADPSGSAGTDVITDASPTDLSGRGEFGGIVIDGWARSNNQNADNEASSEVDVDLTDGFRWYGGTDDSDSSGSITYAVIAESGVTFRADEEIQGLTLEGVGSGTTIEHLQILGSEDDGIEWFGGTVDVKWAVINGVDDDALDMDLGYRGNVQFAIVRQGASNGNYGIESDGNGDDFAATPPTEPVLANITILGNAGRSDEVTTGAKHREGWQGQVYRAVYMDDTAASTAFEGGCLDIDSELPAELAYYDAIFACSPANLADDDEN